MKCLGAIMVAGLLASPLNGCVTAKTGSILPAETANFIVNVKGSYQTVGDCSFLKLRDFQSGDLTKVDLPSLNTVQVIYGNEAFKVWEINFKAAGADTVVEAHVPPAVWGKNFWPDRIVPLIKQCEQLG